MPSASVGNVITSSSQFVAQVVDSAAIKDGTIAAADIGTDVILATNIAANAVGDSEIAAHTTTKITVPATLFTVAGQVQGDVIYFNGTNWVRLAPGTSGQFLKTLGASANPAWAALASTYKFGAITRLGNAADGAVTTAHGLGATPSRIRITAYKNQQATSMSLGMSVGVYDGTTTACIWFEGNDGVDDSSGLSTSNILIIPQLADQSIQMAAVATFDATNITLTYTKTGTPNNRAIQILWEAWS